jgi:hypothetical protein
MQVRSFYRSRMDFVFLVGEAAKEKRQHATTEYGVKLNKFNNSWLTQPAGPSVFRTWRFVRMTPPN